MDIKPTLENPAATPAAAPTIGPIQAKALDDADKCTVLRDVILTTRTALAGEDARADLWEAAARAERARKRSLTAARAAKKGGV